MPRVTRRVASWLIVGAGVLVGIAIGLRRMIHAILSSCMGLRRRIHAILSSSIIFVPLFVGSFVLISSMLPTWLISVGRGTNHCRRRLMRPETD